jgi:pyruvate/2-oxoglutarate dehydrogenase complex dihydrolipoamide dehydrogenase (E3) component
VPNVQGLDLEKAGINYDHNSGVGISDTMQTSNKNVYAVGDCCVNLQFTHMADNMARAALLNSLLGRSNSWKKLIIPRVTYTDPEVAQVGMNARELDQEKIEYDVYESKMEDNERAVCDGEETGYVKIFCKKGGDKILGAVIVCGRAGEMINEITLCMKEGIGLGAVGSKVPPYPTYGESIVFAGRQYTFGKISNFKKGFVRKWLKI